MVVVISHPLDWVKPESVLSLQKEQQTQKLTLERGPTLQALTVPGIRAYPSPDPGTSQLTP